jgi:HlyD family secretion protein
MRYDDIDGGKSAETQRPSLFDDEKTPRRHITRNGVKFQRRLLIGVVGVITLATGAVIYLSSHSAKVPVLENWQSDRVVSTDWKDSLELSSTAELEDSRALSMPERGVITALLVEEGDAVAKGQVLVKVQPEDLPDSLKTAKVNLDSQLRNLEKTKTQYSFTVRQSEQDLKTAQRDLADARKNLELQKKLQALGSTSDDDVATAQSKADSASDRIDQLKLQAEQNAALHELNIKGAAADIQTLQDSIADINARIAACTVTSPINGKVLQIDSSARESGLLMSQYASILTVADQSRALLKAKLPEEDAGKVKKGQMVSLVGDSGLFSGNVERIGALALTDSSTYGTYLDLYVRPAKDAPELRSGASVSMTLKLGERSGVMVLKRGSWYAGSSQDFVYVVQGTKAVKTKVAIGSATTRLVEVVSGLKPGDTVITSSYQSIAGYDTVDLAAINQ